MGFVNASWRRPVRRLQRRKRSREEGMAEKKGKPKRTPRRRFSHEPTRTGLGAAALGQALLDNLTALQAGFPAIATPHDWYMALAYTVRDRLMQRWIRSAQSLLQGDSKVACYLSAEF